MADISKIKLEDTVYNIKDNGARDGKINVAVFDKVSDMLASTTLEAGSKALTYGFYSAGDGGGALYLINEDTTPTSVNGYDVLELGSGLIASLVKDNINVKQYGAKGDNETDDIDAIQAAISNNAGKAIFFPAGTYLISEPIEITVDDTSLIGENEKAIIKKTTDTASSYIGNYNENYFDFSSYPAIISVLFPKDENIARFTIENLNLTSNTDSRVNYGIVAPHLSYSMVKGCRFNNLTTAITLGGWCNTVSKCHSFTNTKPFYTEYAINTTVENCSSSLGSWDIKNAQEFYISGTQADNGNPSFLITNSSNVTLSGCATETYSKVLRNVNSKVMVVGGDFEGHSASGVTFGGFFDNANNGVTIVEGATVRYNDVASLGTPATTAVISCNTGEVVLKNPTFNLPYTYTVYVASSGKAQIDDEFWSNESFVKNVRKLSNNFSASGGEIIRLPFAYGTNYMMFVKSYGSVLHTALSVNSVLNCCANGSSTVDQEVDYEINSNNSSWHAKLTATRDSDTNELVIAYTPTSGSSIQVDSVIEWYKM